MTAGTALELLPTLYAHADDQRLLILEDVGVQGDADDLVDALAALHVRTRSLAEPFPDTPHESILSIAAGSLAAETLAVALALGVAWHDDVASEVARLLLAIREDSFSCLTHGDVCIGNARRGEKAARLLDFADAGRGTPVIDVAVIQLGLPGCGTDAILDAERSTALLERYRRSATVGYPEWKDVQLFRAFVGVGCGFWALRIVSGRHMDPRRIVTTHRGWAPEVARLLRTSAAILDDYPCLRAFATSVESAVQTKVAER